MVSKLTDLELDECQRQGQDLYRQRKYQAALQRFNTIVQQKRKTPLAIFDSRAATYVKLGDLPAALKDGRSMIEDHKTSCSGYLRTGQILQLLKKDDAASSIYKYGLRNVPSTDANRKLIQGAYDKLIKRGSPSKTIDPLLVLPSEIAKMVFECLNFRHIVTATRVSQSWRAFLSSMPQLWSNLDFSNTNKNIPTATFAAYIKRARGRVNSATLFGTVPSQRSILRLIANRCRSIAHLQIYHGIIATSLVDASPALKSLETLIVGAEISLDSLSQVLVHCGKLRKAEFLCVTARHQVKWTGDLSKLRYLTINAKDSVTWSAVLQLETLILKIPNIKQLSFCCWTVASWGDPVPDFSSLEQLESLSLVKFNPSVFPLLPSSIKTLDVSSWYLCNASANRENIRSASLHALTSLSTSNLSHFYSVELFILLEPNKGNLRTLNIHGFTEDAHSLRHLVKSGYLSGVVELGMNSTHVNDEVAEDLATSLPCLTTLEISYTNITGVGVKALTEKPGSKLEQLNLDGCQEVGVDAVEYARQRGVKVSFKFPEHSKGKRIRI